MQFFADFTKESKAVITISVDASESSRFAFLENDIFYVIMLWTRVWKILASEADEFS